MTRRRPSNKKPTGVNKSLGNSLANERDRNRKKHRILQEDDLDNPAFVHKEEENHLISQTYETNVDELLSKAELAGATFESERGAVQIVDKDSSVVVRTAADVKKFNEFRQDYENLLRIPRRPHKAEYSTPEELIKLENEVFLNWRSGLAQLQEMDGVVLTPFERNPDIWRELWRVVEKSDVVVQIVDARNPLLFRCTDLEDYVESVDPAKKNVILINKADLLLPAQRQLWAEYFKTVDADVIFWSALEEKKVKELEKSEDDEEDNDGQEREEGISGEGDADIDEGDDLNASQLLQVLRDRAGPSFLGGRPVVVGFVGYPNVGKSSTLNKLLGAKRVRVSATPGKTKRLQTIEVDKQLTLCDCPGLVMPSLAFHEHEMFLNGILAVEQLRDHYGPVDVLLSRVPAWFIADRFSLTLPDDSISSHALLTAIAFMRGLMSSSGVPDCSRAARVLLKDVVCGDIRWVAAPPSVDQNVFDEMLYPKVETGKKKGNTQLEQMEKKGLLALDSITTKQLDSDFFASANFGAHIEFRHPGVKLEPSQSTSKKHFKKKDKAKRCFPGMYS